MERLIFEIGSILLAIVLGLLCGIVLNKVESHFIDKKLAEQRLTNTISEEKIRKCICFKPDNGPSIDDVINALKDENVEFHMNLNNLFV